MKDELERRIEMLEMNAFGYVGSFWHSIGKLSDGTITGQIGAMTHIIDPVTKRAISKGYHEITVIHSDHYRGQTGSRSEEFRAVKPVTPDPGEFASTNKGE